MSSIKQILFRFQTLFFVLVVFATSCDLNEVKTEIETPDWSILTHGNVENPDYSIVFPDNMVNRMDILIEKEIWDEMLTDLSSKINNSGGKPLAGIDIDPVWVPCDVFFNGIQWYKVGIRFKGNSSLKSTYQSGLKKFPFKLDFDQFEDVYPDISNQRFYGFKQLSLKNNFEDRSLIREKIASELFDDFGLVSAKTAFYRLYIDYGEGSVYFGLYTMVEEVDDTVIDYYFDDNRGNLYKPDGQAASFASGTFNTNEMDKKNNLTVNDYSDVRKLYNIINSAERVSDYNTWKNNLALVFDVDVFLKWLSANSIIQNWDTYGKMWHNYYLYNDPENGKFIWIPWDNNESLQEGKQGGALSIELDEVTGQWPLIRYILDDEEWFGVYKSYCSEFLSDVFYPSGMHDIYDEYQSLIEEFVIGENGEQSEYTFLRNDSEFLQAVNQLKKHVYERNDAVNEFIGSE
ncbi:MAG: CotH kinase family protein [Prolixibacteraceae bacterium]|nr:CotH kinase family protein [Prolixibacteraceae bacterium]